MNLKDLYPLIHEFAGRVNPNINTLWKQSIEDNNRRIVRDAFQRYPSRYILGIETPVKDIWDITRAALDMDDTYTIRQLMHTCTASLPVRWEHLIYSIQSREMARLFLLKGYKDKILQLLAHPDLNTLPKEHVNIIGTVIGSNILLRGINKIEKGNALDIFLRRHLRSDSLMILDPVYSFNINISHNASLNTYLSLNKYGYIDNPMLKAIIQDNIQEYKRTSTESNVLPIECILFFDAKKIVSFLHNTIKDPNTDLDLIVIVHMEYARGTLLSDLLKVKGWRTILLKKALEEDKELQDQSIDYIDLILSLYPDLISEHKEGILSFISKNEYKHLLDKYT